MKIPKSHPRYASLVRRETLVQGWRDGIVVPEGLIAQGRGEAFDYLFGEETIAPAIVAEKAAAAFLLKARNPVISVNGNVAALAAPEAVRLSRAIPARLEVNLFHRTEARAAKIAQRLEAAGAESVLARRPDARIPGLESKRALTHRRGIFTADAVLVPLEDGDRTEALVRMGKTVISVDLNPLSRTSQKATVPIVDDVARALSQVERAVLDLRGRPVEVDRVARTYSKAGNLKAVYRYLEWRLRGLGTGSASKRGMRRTAHRPRGNR